MNRTFSCIITLAMLFSSCSLYPDTSMYENIIPNSGAQVEWKGWRVLFPDKSDVDLLAFIVSYEITYLDDEVEYWQTPEETWSLRTGDCEDKCILFMGLLAEHNLLRDHTLLAVRLSDWSYHAVVYDPNTYKVYELSDGSIHIRTEYDIRYEYDYSQVMYQAYEHVRLDWF